MDRTPDIAVASQWRTFNSWQDTMSALRRSRSSLRPSRQFRIEALEVRRMMHTGPHPNAADLVAADLTVATAQLTAEVIGGDLGIEIVDPIPQLSSLPGAPATLYLDFDGHFQSQFNGQSNITTGAFDRDGDPSTFSQTDVDAISQIWAHVAEDFAPFNINVTTLNPGDFSNSSQNLRIAIGGTTFTSESQSGISQINSFNTSAPNVAYAFGRKPDGSLHSLKKIGDVVSHEAGHSFGLFHQSTYSSLGAQTAEYNPGDNTRGLIMGSTNNPNRTTWSRGPSSVSGPFPLSTGEGQYLIPMPLSYILGQDDLSRLARGDNGFGYRPDDHAYSFAASTPLLSGADNMTASGIIEKTTDKDVFRFETGGGQVTIDVRVARYQSTVVGNLDVAIELRSAAGLIATSNPAGQLDAQIATNLAPGTYHIVVGSNGAYGDVGQYTVEVTERVGPRIVSATTVSVSSTLDGLWVTFNEPINPASFTISDVTVWSGLSSLVVVSVGGTIVDGDGRTFLISYNKPMGPIGATVKVGPAITDYFGNAMDQDRDGLNGETYQDQYVKSGWPIDLDAAAAMTGMSLSPTTNKTRRAGLTSAAQSAVDAFFAGY
jgi:reprolysin-like metallo-peptidase family M12B